MAIYKSFIRAHLDYHDIIYDHTFNVSFQQKEERILCNGVVAITGAIPETSKKKLFEDLGLNSLQHRRWYRELWCFYKTLKEQSPKYIFNMIPTLTRPYSTRNANNITHFKVWHSFFKNTLFSSVIIEWSKLVHEFQNDPSLNILQKNILKFITLTTNNIFDWHNLKDIKYLRRLRLAVSYLYEH